jgi:hypothetical protein
MPVVINEFEVVPEEPAPAARQGQAPAQAQAPAKPSPHELAELLRREAGRAARVRAH